MTGRTPERAEDARQRLVERTDKEVFVPVCVDLNRSQSVQALVEKLADQSYRIDLLLLKAGMVAGNEFITIDEGVEVTFASSPIAHHQLNMGLLADKISPDRRRREATFRRSTPPISIASQVTDTMATSSSPNWNTPNGG